MAVPLYAARVEHLQHAPTISVQCACGHRADLSVAVIRAKLSPNERVLDLWMRLKCERCGVRGKCQVDARAALGNL